ncbi:MAG: family 43 glycosylhydrolase [Bacteroidales bacterium]|nr:family 43 glycosylhydrolase [Bacteroidales bacterium]
MKKFVFYLSVLTYFLLFLMHSLQAQNPLILDQFTADPSARVFEGKVYVYPLHDIRIDTGRFATWFCMEDYHVFSSENLTQWKDHGVIVSQNDVQWVDPQTYSMWAPDCIYRNGKYYFYFPAITKDKTDGRRMSVGVAISDKPYGPFIPESKPIEGISGIDPNPFIDTDGQAYIYWAGNKRIFMAKLNDNMLELASEPQEIANLPEKFKEGPYLFERKGKYYLTFPFVPDSTEQIVYAMGYNPMGPFTYTGVIMDESPVGCWTNHQSIIEYKGQWYLFYHHNDLSPDFDKNRSIRADSLFFNEDGTIQKVIPTWRGVGLTSARDTVQIDRYSEISNEGVSVEFLDTLNKQKGWKTRLNGKGAWIQYNSINFGNKDLNSILIKAKSLSGSIVEIRLDQLNGPMLARLDIGKSKEWEVVNSALLDIPEGIHNLVFLLNGTNTIDIDWIKFE